MLPSEQLTSAPTMVHEPCAGCTSIDQLMPEPVGSGSLMVTPLAVPGPPLLTVTVKPMSVPVLTGVLSAVLVMPSDGHCTVVDACAMRVPFSLPTVAVAWLSYTAQLAYTVVLVMCTV